MTRREDLRLDAPAQVGGVRFGKGIKWETVIHAAQRHYEHMNTPEREAERIKKAGAFFKQVMAEVPVPETPEEAAAHELQACRDMLEDARSDLAAVREALGVPYEPHQTLRCRLLEAARAKAVPADYKAVPLEPTEAQWGGLARDIIKAWDLGYKTPRTLFLFLQSIGAEVPKWMRDEPEMRNLDSIPSKGTRAALIYRAMLEEYKEFV